MSTETRDALIDAMLEARKQRYLHPWAPGTERAFRDDCERELAAVLPLVADAIEAQRVTFDGTPDAFEAMRNVGLQNAADLVRGLLGEVSDV